MTELEQVPKEKLEPHISIKVGSYLDIWHIFGPAMYETRGKKKVVVLITKCGKRIYDAWNTRSTFNFRYDRPCGQCFPNGVTSQGRAKPSKRDSGPREDTEDAGSTGEAGGSKQANTGSGVALNSTAEPLVSATSDAGDDAAASKEGSGVQRAGDRGHVEELPEGGGAGGSDVEGSPDEKAGQGKQVHQPSKGSAQRPAGGRKSQGHSDR